MRNQRTNAIITALAVMLATVLGAGAFWYGTQKEAWTGPLCNQIRSAIAWTDGRISTALPGSDAKADLETQRGELETQLADANCGTDSPPPTPTPTPTPTQTQTPELC